MKLVKSWFDKDSLRLQLLRRVLAPMVVLLLFNAVFSYKIGLDSSNRRHDHFLFDLCKILVDQLSTNQNGEVEFAIHDGTLDMLEQDKDDLVFYSLSGLRGEYLYGYADLPLPAEKLSTTPIHYEASFKGHPVRMMAVMVVEPDVPDGYVNVVMAKTKVVHHERIWEWVWRILPIQLTMVLIAGGVLWFAVGRSLRPLSQMSDEVGRRSALDLSPLPEHNVVGEVRPLIHNFNELMGRLGKSAALQQRFIADASHQLRTPLTGLKAQVEFAMRLNDEAEIRHSLQQMYKATEHAAHLVNQLLSLARVEPSVRISDNLIDLDLAALARKTTEHWVQPALKKNIDLGFEADGEVCTIKGNAMLLVEMLNNLIDNALRYTHRNGQVTVRISRDATAFNLEVEDNGRGIPENERMRVFERFYRVLGSNQEGCGLGLPIVREIAHRHDAEVYVLSGANGIGTLMRVNFRLS